MNPLQIKQAIERAGVTQSEIARRCGVTCTAVNRVIWRGDVSDSIRREIARVIVRDVCEIWPDYYMKAANG